MRKNISGFTLVELIVVIAVIGILAGISIVGFSRYQADARDTQRSNRANLIAEALEKFYLVNGEYPSCSAMTGLASTVTSNTLRNLDTSVLKTPRATSGVTNSILCQDLTNASTGPDIFSYIGDGSSDCTGSGSCLQYTIKYKDEGTGTIKTIFSRHKTDIATSGTPTITASTVNSSSINLSWTKVSNATSYTVQSTTDSTFASGVVVSTNSALSTVASGLSQNTQYYFRVAANTSNAQSSWSNSANARTLAVLVAPPSVTATTNSSSQITVAWGSVTDATSYTLDYSVNSSFTSATSISGMTSTSRAIPGLLQGQSYYFRVTAVNATSTGPASAATNAITTVDTPGAPSVVQSTSGNTTTYTWSTVSCPANTTVRYQYQYIVDYSGGYVSSWYSAGNSQSTTYYSSDEGYQYTTAVRAQCYNASSSAWGGSGSASYVRPVQPPSSIRYSISRNGANNSVYVFATVGCTNGAYVYGRADMHTWDLVWSDSRQLGWWGASHAGSNNTVWASNDWQYWGTRIGVGTIRGTAGATMATGWRWNIAIDAYCGNYYTGRASGTIGRKESPAMATPADLNQEVFY